MSSSLPLWALFLSGAVGGSFLTLVGTFGAKIFDRRHRHDDEIRRHYLAMVDSLDTLFQSVLNAVDRRNVYAARFVRNGDLADLMRNEMYEAAKATDESYAAARRTFQLVSFFAPYRVLLPLQAVYDGVSGPFRQVHEPFPNPEDFPDALPVPTWPEDEFQEFKSAVRKELGVGFPIRDRLSMHTQRLRRRVEPAPGPDPVTAGL